MENDEPGTKHREGESGKEAAQLSLSHIHTRIHTHSPVKPRHRKASEWKNRQKEASGWRTGGAIINLTLS